MTGIEPNGMTMLVERRPVNIGRVEMIFNFEGGDATGLDVAILVTSIIQSFRCQSQGRQIRDVQI